MTEDLKMKYDTPGFKEIAVNNTIILTQVGSGAHGIALEGHDDRDEMGICVEPPEYVVGLKKFEQYEHRTQPRNARSGPGDLDLTIYSLRKWMRLAIGGNPTIILPLFVHEDDIISIDADGEYLRNNPDLVISKKAGDKFKGYLHSQREKMLQNKSGTNRPELIEKFGYDTKFAAHMIRLGIQGIELLSTGRITLPVPEPYRSLLIDIRLGKSSQEELLSMAIELEKEIDNLNSNSSLPIEPDINRINSWLFNVYQKHWSDS